VVTSGEKELEQTTISREIEESVPARLVPFSDRKQALEKLRQHKLDLVMEHGTEAVIYWINESSPKGKAAESILIKSLIEPEKVEEKVVRQTVQGRRIEYLDWLFPGILAMNMMFSALYGVGYVIVRYRKIGVLKRLKATPTTAFEFLAAQVLSRMYLLLVTNGVVYAVCLWIFNFQCEGSFFDLLVIFCLGSSANIALGLVVAGRTESEEFANGLLNLIAWPMMFLSEVWFSLEGSPEWIRKFSDLLPLSHVTEGMRRIMNDGAGISELAFEIAALSIMTIVFTAFGSFWFRWMKP
jgi:ABC-type multidrug transport system permease subunit